MESSVQFLQNGHWAADDRTYDTKSSIIERTKDNTVRVLQRLGKLLNKCGICKVLRTLGCEGRIAAFKATQKVQTDAPQGVVLLLIENLDANLL